MTNWTELEHAYGEAGDVPELLKAVEGPEDAEAWDELWSYLCHQGTVYSASYAALPALLGLASRRPPANRHDPLMLAGAIIASDDTPERVSVDDIRQKYRAELAAFEALTHEALEVPELRGDATTFVFLLQTLLAFQGEPVWQRQLESLAEDGYSVTCPGCDECLSLTFDDDHHAVVEDDEGDDDAVRLPLAPALPASLTGIGARLHRFTEEHGQPKIAHQLTYLFGRATCPACRTEFSPSDAVVTLG